MTIRVVLADDHPLIIVGVRQKLADAGDIAVVADADNSRVLMDILRTTHCDVLVTDFSMPCENAPDGLAMLNAIRIKFPALRVVVLTMLENAGLVASMQAAGVLGVVNKRDDLSELPAVIRAAYQGRTGLGTSLRAEMENWASRISPDSTARNLSPRELEVVRLCVSGMTTTEVARHLHRSANTVSTQKHSAMRKLGVTNDAELFDYAQAHGLKS
ncbi:LuxR family two component transcriptional regulator [Cupriavidus alkaliphilus]|nr:response regulator transcription factor [Cupriavidus alkaliphilus]RAS03502.1 LuxR family two component transcriptional regulator [Cupriavidus alkaliphilus]